MAGGIGVAVGTTGVDNSELGVDVSPGVSVGTGIELVALVSAPAIGVKVSRAMTLPLLPFIRVETAP